MSATERHVLRLSGYAPALPTPFDDAGELDPTLFAVPRLGACEDAAELALASHADQGLRSRSAKPCRGTPRLHDPLYPPRV